MINIGTPKTVSLWNTPPKGSFILMIYLPEEEIVQLDIAVIGSGDCSFHPLDKLLLCLNVHFFIWKLMFIFILFHSKLTTDENFECALCIVLVLKQWEKSCRHPRPFSSRKWSQNPGLNSPLELSYTILFDTLYSSSLQFSYPALSSYLTALLVFS